MTAPDSAIAARMLSLCPLEAYQSQNRVEVKGPGADGYGQGKPLRSYAHPNSTLVRMTGTPELTTLTRLQ